jgi:L-threonylcarbamoyladenylate synthase
MNTQLILSTDPQCVSLAADLLAQGEVVALPTETVYGLAADAAQLEAVNKIYQVKQRPSGHPLIMHFADLEAMRPWVKAIPPLVEKLAQACWPGPLSVLLWRSDLVTDAVTGGSDKVCVRIPSHETTRAIIRRLGHPIVAPSANMFGAVSPTSAAHVMQDLQGKIAAVVDGGECQVGLESTILDMTGSQPVLMRPGGYSLPQLEAVLGCDILTQHDGKTQVSGNLLNHYQPHTRLQLFQPEADYRSLAQGSILMLRAAQISKVQAASVTEYRMPLDAKRYAQMLYAVLRLLDQGGYQQILIEMPPDTPEWMAVRDRISKALHKSTV